MSVHLNLRNGKIRTDDKEDIVQTAAPAAQETAAQTSADYERHPPNAERQTVWKLSELIFTRIRKSVWNC